MKENKGITLIVLVITIIVMLILVTVSIQMVIRTGLFDEAKNAVKLTEGAHRNEQKLGEEVTINGKTYASIDDYMQNKEKVEAGKRATATSTYISGNKAATIPEGFTVSGNTNENTIDGGLVIYLLDKKEDGTEWTDEDIANIKWDDPATMLDLQKKYDQFVWIPVSDEKYNEMIVTSETEYTLQDNKTSTNVYSRIYTWTGDSQKEAYDINEYVPGSKLTAEPESIRDSSNDVEKYKKMLESLKKYHGFYVGRYELGKNEQDEAVIQKDAIPYGGITWQNFLNICENINANASNVTTEIIWGCQWDRICDWLSSEADSSGRTYNVVTSNWGNYIYFTENGEYVTDDIEEASKLWGDYGEHITSRGILNTGSDEEWKAKNIYDFAGNVWEWTQQGYDWYARVCRGGGAGWGTNVGAAGVWNLDAGYQGDPQYGTRCSMYIN